MEVHVRMKCADSATPTCNFLGFRSARRRVSSSFGSLHTISVFETCYEAAVVDESSLVLLTMASFAHLRLGPATVAGGGGGGGRPSTAAIYASTPVLHCFRMREAARLSVINCG